MTPVTPAAQRQNEASDPAVSVWLGANAGSGKTKVLTDRVARLLLAGTEPQNILCMTYTKAAAAEMQNRLFQGLGKWAMLPDTDLRQALNALGTRGQIDTEQLRRARTLFARAVETPGGLRIRTIHAFCAAILRSFPLEAGVSPRFKELDDKASAQLRAEVVEAMAMGPDAALVERLVRHISTDDDLTKLTREIVSHLELFLPPRTEAELRRLVGLPDGMTEAGAIATAFDGTEPDLSRKFSHAFRDAAVAKSFHAIARDIAALDLSQPNRAAFDALSKQFLYAKSGLSKSSNYPPSGSTNIVPLMAPIAPEIHAWMDRVAEAFSLLRRLDMHAINRDLHAFAAEFLARFQTIKRDRGVLDFDDQIRLARRLLNDPSVAAWVLYRLDGGIDHVLIDEAQDTSPAQWDLIRGLTQEFAAGDGARSGVERTVFVVGDKKQSIYSFQGADPVAFDLMQAHFATEFGRIGGSLNQLGLHHSFRSSPAILAVVDQTFAGAPNAGAGEPVTHEPFLQDLPGRVDLWPLTGSAAPDAERPEWYIPTDIMGRRSDKLELANMVAAEVRRMVSQETIPLQDRETGALSRRPITEADILILVRSRGELSNGIIRACKAAGLRVAGSDRLKICEELVVKDILALLQFLVLPEDDLSLAAALRSPLFCWTEQQLYALAQPRPEGMYLWQALRAAPEHEATLQVLGDLLERVDFDRPYDLIERILTRHGGRLRLLARLGHEVEDFIDALLAQAMDYEERDVPSLTGFLDWLQSEDVEVQRRLDASGGEVRVMTIHGAKGLESPIVLLPDTGPRKAPVGGKLLAGAEAVSWKGRKENLPPEIAALNDARIEREDLEEMRLLYVAMTRAEKWLIACGTAGTAKTLPEYWHSWIAEGMERAGAVDCAFPSGSGKRHAFGDWPGLPLETAVAAPRPPVVAPVLPDVAEPDRASRATLSPSQLGGAKVLPGDADPDEAGAALEYGRLMHLLLEVLPLEPPAARHEAGLALMAGQDDPPPLHEAAQLVADAIALLDAPELQPLFASDTLAEVPISADVLGRRMHGVIDRLVVTPDRVLAVDFKTNRLVPDQPAAVPDGLLRQMAAYAAMLAEVYPDRRVETALLWTARARLMPLQQHLLTEALARSGGP